MPFILRMVRYIHARIELLFLSLLFISPFFLLFLFCPFKTARPFHLLEGAKKRERTGFSFWPQKKKREKQREKCSGRRFWGDYRATLRHLRPHRPLLRLGAVGAARVCARAREVSRPLPRRDKTKRPQKTIKKPMRSSRRNRRKLYRTNQWRRIWPLSLTRPPTLCF